MLRIYKVFRLGIIGLNYYFLGKVHEGITNLASFELKFWLILIHGHANFLDLDVCTSNSHRRKLIFHTLIVGLYCDVND